MKLTNVEKKENSQIELSILVEAEEFEKACEQSYRKNVKNINVQGFRKGKAPRKMIEKLYGKEVFYEDAMSFSYPGAYEKALEEADIEPIANPNLTDFDISDAGEFTFKAVVQVKPDVEVKQYKGFEAEKGEVKVEKEEVDAEIERLLERNSRLVTVEREAKDGDTVMIDFEGFVDGVAFEGGKGDNFALKLGSGMFIPGFEEQLVGKKAGEECDVNVTFPEEYQAEELAGKAAVFKCKVNEVKESEKPELDDEFAKDVSEFDTLEAYKEDLEKKILERKTAQADSDFDDALRRQLVENLVVEIPDVMVETQLDRVADDFNYRLSMQGISLEMYLQMNQMDMAQFRSLFKDQAVEQVKTRLALEKVAELESLSPAEEDVDNEIKKLAEQNGISEERVVEIIGRVPLRRDLAVQKAMDLIRDNAKVVKAKKTTKKKAEDKAEEKPAAKKPAAKKAAAGEEKPAAKKPAAKKAAASGEEKPAAKKPAAKKTAKKEETAE